MFYATTIVSLSSGISYALFEVMKKIHIIKIA